MLMETVVCLASIKQEEKLQMETTNGTKQENFMPKNSAHQFHSLHGF